MTKDDFSKVVYRQDPETLELVVKALREGDVMVLPCDTIYGLCAKVGQETMESIYALKERDQRKPFLLLATMHQAKEICQVPPEVEKVWPCALTAIMRNREDGGTTAIRVPSDAFLQSVLEKLGSPIYSTSVNLSGYASMTNITDIILTFKGKVPLFVVAGEKQGTVPSTLIDCTVRPFKVIRQGAFDASSLLR
jgi:L-threonylcarbamoyladenylate synthase